jgi:hypothetical protein
VLPHVDPVAVVVELSGLPFVAGVDVHRALAPDDLPPLLDPAGEVVAPAQRGLGPDELAVAQRGRRLGAHEHSARDRGGLAEALPDLEPEAVGGQGLDPVETGVVEVDGPDAVDAERSSFSGEC